MQRYGFPPSPVAGVLAIWLIGAVAPVQAADPGARDTRSITVESTLKDLSRSNDAAISDKGITPIPGKDALGQPRTDLVVTPPPDVARIVSGDVQSSLHRLKRETAIHQTPDARKARVQEAEDRRAEDVTSDTRAALSDP